MERCCKVGRVAADRGLQHHVVSGSFDDYLAARWVGRNEFTGEGTKSLADWFNQEVIKAAYEGTDRPAVARHIESDYEVLRGDDEDAQVRLARELEADGVDPSALVEDFVSKPTMYRHLTECLDESKSNPTHETENAYPGEGQVSYAVDQLQEKVEEALAALDRTGTLPGAADATVQTPVYVQCPHCPTKVKLGRAVERGFVCSDHRDPGEAEDRDQVATRT